MERWNRTFVRDIASLVSKCEEEWDDHFTLACFRYSTGICTATRIKPYKAMFGVEAFEACGNVDTAGLIDEPEDLARRLSLLHKQLL